MKNSDILIKMIPQTNLFAGEYYKLEDGIIVKYVGFDPKYGHWIIYVESQKEFPLPHNTKFFEIE